MLNNFLGQFFRKASTISAARIKNGLFIKKGVNLFPVTVRNILFYGLQKFVWLICVLVVNHST